MPEAQDSNVGALSQLAYGDGPTPGDSMQQALRALLPTPEQTAADERKVWRGGLGSSGTGHATDSFLAADKAVANWRLEQQKLKAQYIPLILQSIAQQQQLTLQAAQASREYLQNINPRIDSHLAALMAGGNQPTYQQAVETITNVGEQYGLSPSLTMSKIKALPKDPVQLNAYLQRLAAGTAGADKMLPTTGATAAGEKVSENPVTGTIEPLRTPARAAGQRPEGKKEVNVTSPQVEWETASHGDPKAFEGQLRSRVEAYRQMLTRMNEQSEFIKSFQPGRYAGQMGGLAAAIKDIGNRLPGVEPKAVENIARALLGAKEGSEEALAAQQTFEQLAQQETLAQLRTSLDGAGALNANEYQNFSNVNLGQRMDPATFNNIRKFFFGQAQDALSKYNAWADYLADPNEKNKSVTGFDARYMKKDFEHHLSGKRGSAAAARTEPQRNDNAAKFGVNLSEYEPGAKVGPTGKVYVVPEGQAPRLARKIKER